MAAASSRNPLEAISVARYGMTEYGSGRNKPKRIDNAGSAAAAIALSLNETLPQSSPMAMLMKKMANFSLCVEKSGLMPMTILLTPMLSRRVKEIYGCNER